MERDFSLIAKNDKILGIFCIQEVLLNSNLQNMENKSQPKKIVPFHPAEFAQWQKFAREGWHGMGEKKSSFTL